MVVGYADLRARHGRDLVAVLPEVIERIGWSRPALRAQRDRQLRLLILGAVAGSAWHRRRLGGLDPAAVTEDVLVEVPVMTKDDLLAHFDEIVTDPRLSRGTVEAHLADLHDDAYLLEEFHAFSSGGASGRMTCARWR